MKLISGILIVGLLLGTTVACDDTDPDPKAGGASDPATTTVTVKFRDSSVPPEHHRSWVLTLDGEEVHLVVDSYGDVIADETVEMPAGEWSDFVAELEGSVSALGEAEEHQPCDGGTGMSLDVAGAAGADTKLEVENCGGNNTEVMDEIAELVGPFTELVDLEEHTRT